jgi:hypothetical protein
MEKINKGRNREGKNGSNEGKQKEWESEKRKRN